MVCEECINRLEIEYDDITHYRCILAGYIQLDTITKCSHFKPKKVEDKELGKASDIKDKEILKRKGQSIDPNFYGYNEKVTQ